MTIEIAPQIQQVQKIQQVQQNSEGSSKVVNAILRDENIQTGKSCSKGKWDEWDDFDEWLDIDSPKKI